MKQSTHLLLLLVEVTGWALGLSLVVFCLFRYSLKAALFLAARERLLVRWQRFSQQAMLLALFGFWMALMVLCAVATVLYFWKKIF